MKTFLFFILVCILLSCRKENIYYYSNNKEIKDSTAIRFVDIELRKLNIDYKKKDLKVYTTLDSASYATNLDTIKTKIFEQASYHQIPKNKSLFDKWFREKIIVVDNKTGSVVNFYSTFQKAKYDRQDINLFEMRKFIDLASLLNENPQLEVPENYFAISSPIPFPSKNIIVEDKIVKFLSRFNINSINKNDYYSSTLSFLEVIKIFQSVNRNGIYKEPFVVKQITRNNHIIYHQKDSSSQVLTSLANNKVLQYFNFIKKNKFHHFQHQLKDTQNLLYFGAPPFYSYLINDGKYTYFIYTSGAVVIDPKKKRSVMIPPEWMKRIGIEYYNAIRK